MIVDGFNGPIGVIFKGIGGGFGDDEGLREWTVELGRCLVKVGLLDCDFVLI